MLFEVLKYRYKASREMSEKGQEKKVLLMPL